MFYTGLAFGAVITSFCLVLVLLLCNLFKLLRRFDSYHSDAWNDLMLMVRDKFYDHGSPPVDTMLVKRFFRNEIGNYDLRQIEFMKKLVSFLADAANEKANRERKLYPPTSVEIEFDDEGGFKVKPSVN